MIMETQLTIDVLVGNWDWIPGPDPSFSILNFPEVFNCFFTLLSYPDFYAFLIGIFYIRFPHCIWTLASLILTNSKFVFNLRAIATPDEEFCSNAMEVDGIRSKKIMFGF